MMALAFPYNSKITVSIIEFYSVDMHYIYENSFLLDLFSEEDLMEEPDIEDAAEYMIFKVNIAFTVELHPISS